MLYNVMHACHRCKQPILGHKQPYCKKCYRIHKRQGLEKCESCHLFKPKCEIHELVTCGCTNCSHEFYNVGEDGTAIYPMSYCEKCFWKSIFTPMAISFFIWGIAMGCSWLIENHMRKKRNLVM